MDIKAISKFVFATGIYNFLLGLGLAIPFVTELLKINICDYALALLIGAFLIFTAAVQVIASRDLRTHGWIIFWEGILRWMAAAILIFYGFFGQIGFVAGLIGIGDFLIGIVFLFLLPKALGKKSYELLLGRP